jgi:hypothetical protein
MPQGPLLVPQAGLLSGRRFGEVFFAVPQPSVVDSFAGQQPDVISTFRFPACSSLML